MFFLCEELYQMSLESVEGNYLARAWLPIQSFSHSWWACCSFILIFSIDLKPWSNSTLNTVSDRMLWEWSCAVWRLTLLTVKQAQFGVDYMTCFLFVLPGGHPGVGKTIMRFLGLDLGPARAPLPQLSESLEAGLREELEGIGFFTWR